MSTLSIIKLKLGQAIDATKNFLFDASAQDGSLLLKRESGQEVLRVGTDGKVSIRGGTLSSGQGMVGEILSRNVSTSTVLANSVWTHIGELPLSAGVWDVQLTGQLSASVGVNCPHRALGLGSARANPDVTQAQNANQISSGYSETLTTSLVRLELTAAATLYLSARAVVSTGTVSSLGATVSARRVA